MARAPNKEIVEQYVDDVLSGKKIACKEIKQAARRFKRDLKNKNYEFRTFDPEFIIGIIETMFVHEQGQRLDGTPLLNEPFLLEPWQKFIIYNLVGFYKAGTNERRFKESLIMVPRKNGKALSLDTPVLTTKGWSTMGDIRVGDTVFGKDGQQTKVIYKSDVHVDHECFNVVFDDGEEIKADAEHIWNVTTSESRKKGIEYFNITTKEMIHNLTIGINKVSCQYRVPMQKAIEMPHRELLVDPYALGVWLGDGGIKDCRISKGDDDLLEIEKYINEVGYTTKFYKNDKKCSRLGIGVAQKGKGNIFIQQLKALRIYENKHIPNDYLMSSKEQRLALIQGLMDTDGYCSKRGQCEFSQKSKSIMDDFSFLLSSVGIKNKTKTKKVNGEIYYINHFFTSKELPCFRLKRKLSRLKGNHTSRMKNKSIVSIQPIKSVHTQCIAVDTADHLYLAGKSLTVTHNTPFISAFAFAYALLEKASGSKAYIVASNLRDSMQSFNFLKHNVTSWKNDGWRILDNNQAHSISKKFPTGSIMFEALVARDSIVGNLCILDELHEYKDSATYDRMKKAQKAYTNKLTIGITTAGHKINSFCFDHMRYCQKILSNKIKDEQMFVFITKANEEQGGYVDYTNPVIHEMANPNYGITIRPTDIKESSFQAQEKPISRKEFLAKELNVYTSSIKSYFDLKEFMSSDGKYDWGYDKPIEINGVSRANLSELAKLPIKWFGGADLSKMFDLTAAALYGEYEDVGIILTHCWYPRTRAEAMSENSAIPYFGWEEDGWLDFVNGDVIEYDEVAKWFVELRNIGFDIQEVGYDRQMAREFISIMEGHGFKMEDVPQKYWIKSEGFRRIELKVKKKQYYYMHSEAYEYCVENVKAVEDSSDRVRYEKTDDDMKIDLFDAGVFAVIRFIENMEQSTLDDWYS